MLGELKSFSNLPVGKSLCNTTNHIRISRRKHASIQVQAVGEYRLRERLKNELQLSTVGPNLTMGHTQDALCQQAKRLRTTEHTLCAGPKGFSDAGAFGGIEQDDDPRFTGF